MAAYKYLDTLHIYMCKLLIVDYILTNKLYTCITPFYPPLLIYGLSHTIMNLNCFKILENKITSFRIFEYTSIWKYTHLCLG